MQVFRNGISDMRWSSFLFLPVVLLLAVACEGVSGLTPTLAPSTSTPTPSPRPRPTVTVAASQDCHPSYDEGICLDPNASDYDCRGGSGNGPLYTGRVRVVGPDVFGLDRDRGGIGCE